MTKCVECKTKEARVRFCSNKCKDRFHNKRRGRTFSLIIIDEIDEIDDSTHDDWAYDDDSGVYTI